MIDTQLLRDQVLGLNTRYNTHTETLNWLLGKLDRVPGELLPPTEGDEGQQALSRIGRQVNSIGPRVLTTKRNGAIGNINWGGKNARADELLRGLNLEDIANRVFDRLFAFGIAAVAAIETDAGPQLARLGGHIEPVLDPFDIDTVLGLIQVQAERKSDGHGSHYRVRLWDFSDETPTLREWDRITDASTLRDTAEIVPVAFAPRFAIMQVGPDGLPLGEFQQSLPTVKAEWASQVRGDRVEESTAFPLMKIKGQVQGSELRGPTRMIEVDLEGGDVAYLLPGDLTQMHSHHDRKLERLREDLSLPGGSLGASTPSGEALREANQKFIASSRSYATAVQTIISGGAADYLSLNGVNEDIPVSVDINREYEKAQRIESVIELHQAGLLPLDAAVRSVSVYLPEWSDEMVEAFIARDAQGIGSVES